MAALCHRESGDASASSPDPVDDGDADAGIAIHGLQRGTCLRQGDAPRDHAGRIEPAARDHAEEC